MHIHKHTNSHTYIHTYIHIQTYTHIQTHTHVYTHTHTHINKHRHYNHCCLSPQTSVIFDIKLESKSDGYVNYHYPVLSPLGIRPFKLLLPCEYLLLLSLVHSLLIIYPYGDRFSFMGCSFIRSMSMHPMSMQTGTFPGP